MSLEIAETAPRPSNKRHTLLGALLLLVGTLAYAKWVIRDFSGPLIGGRDYDGAYRGDANYFEFLGYYVRDHYHFGLNPIRFFTTDVAYPEGTHIGLLSWCAERDLFHALLLKWMGPGPWIQVYLTLGAAAGAVGVAWILTKEFGVLRASCVGFAASFMSFYAWYKYPYHLNMCALHWVTMSIALDAVTMRIVARGERLTLQHLLLRAALILLSFGLDLGYVLGHALTSFLVTALFSWSLLASRDPRIFGRLSLVLPAEIFAEMRRAKGAFVGLFAMLSVALFVYVPFVFAVVRDTTTYPMADAVGNFWASQFHALFPYLPGVHPNSKLVHEVFGHDEGIGEYTPGFALLGAAAVGFWQARKHREFAPIKALLVTALLVFAFHPRWCKTLQVFPWFAYYRVAGRGTVVLPVLLALIAVSARTWTPLAKRVVGLLALAEFLTALFLVNEYRPAILEPQHRKYFETIRTSPGKGLLEWPFCIASANFVITKELCPHYGVLATAYAYRRFHEKSTVSIYLSRVAPEQFKHWLDQGWEGMFMTDDPTREHATREVRCFSEEQWDRFDRLYRTNDFAGIQLYTELLPHECVEAFHLRYGEPFASETLPRLGRVEFLRRGLAQSATTGSRVSPSSSARASPTR